MRHGIRTNSPAGSVRAVGIARALATNPQIVIADKPVVRRGQVMRRAPLGWLERTRQHIEAIVANKLRPRG
jgi:ABC-type phosphate/phosphonate transport system ATPase subunit